MMMMFEWMVIINNDDKKRSFLIPKIIWAKFDFPTKDVSYLSYYSSSSKSSFVFLLNLLLVENFIIIVVTFVSLLLDFITIFFFRFVKRFQNYWISLFVFLLSHTVINLYRIVFDERALDFSLLFYFWCIVADVNVTV